MTAVQKTKRIYCFDASAFITLSRTSDNVIEISQKLWEGLEKMMKTGDIISHRIVFDEISSGTKNPDFITKWVVDKQKYFLPRTDAQIVQVPKIVQKFPGLIDYQQEREQADPWLIALAMEKSKEANLFEIHTCVVVSQESPRSSKKIPEACKAFGVEHLALRQFFDEIGLNAKFSKK